MTKIACFKRKERNMERMINILRKIICYTGACIIAPWVIILVIVNRLICFMSGFMAFVVYTNAPEVSDMTLDIAKSIGDKIDTLQLQYECGEYIVG